MSEHPKNSRQKNKNEPKEQRRKRENRHPSGPENKNVEKDVEIKKVPKEKSESKFVEPPPEFYKNLKRETEDILKITEEENSKYKKKEIQSNWAKYEMPIESYEEIDQQESIGADYESLIQATLSVGGHFQFKHEKSWNVSQGPSPYDKYFEINMDNLSIALSSIPFYERNNIDMSSFSETDIQTMNHRATKYKDKYFNDKMYITPEMEAENKILNLIKSEDEIFPKEKEDQDIKKVNVDLEKISLNNELKESSKSLKHLVNQTETDKNKEHLPKPMQTIDESNKNREDQEDMLDNVLNVKEINKDESKVILDTLQQDQHVEENESVPEKKSENPLPIHPSIIESNPEDLEKWLDDFLDG